MTRAELLAWADDPGRQRSEIAAAVRRLFEDFRMLTRADDAPGYETLRAEIEQLRADISAYERELGRLRAELAGLRPRAPWET